MSTQIDHVQVASGPRAINLGSAAGIGVALLVVGLAIGLIVGGLLAGGAEPAASKSVASVAPAAAKVPALSWKDDYATRHPELSRRAPVLSWKDDYATRHPDVGELP
jgi:hypothetical protein